ncbi:GNAT family N-acetyltransferase, partial [Bacillus cereus]
MVKSPILFLNTNEREYTMAIQKKRSVTESEIQQMKDLAYI